MLQIDEVVSGWLEGSDSVDGCDNPAGPLYTEGQETVEAALSSEEMAFTQTVVCATFGGGTTCSFGGGCLCC